MRLPFLVLFIVYQSAALAQAYLTGLGGTAALSRDASASASPIASANYDAAVGPALSASAGYRFNDWLSAQARYGWNQNRITVTELTALTFVERMQPAPQHSVAAELLVYFRPRGSRLRPYLSAGPAWSRVLAQNKPGLTVAVGIDVSLKSGWGVRYTFVENMSANPFSAALHPAGTHGLMNFQNQLGVIKFF